jgi:hypothetical protein
MANNYQSFDEWYTQLDKLAKEHRWNIENPDEWRAYYQGKFTPEQTLRTETGAPDDSEDPAGY